MQVELVLIIAFLLGVIFWLYNKQNKEKIFLNDLQGQIKKLENGLLDTADNIVGQIQEVSTDLEEKLEDAHGTLAALKEEIAIAEKKNFALTKIDVNDLALNFTEAKNALEDLKIQINNIEQRKVEVAKRKFPVIRKKHFHESTIADFRKKKNELFNSEPLLLLESKSQTSAEVVFDFPTLLGQSETALVEEQSFLDDESLPKHSRIISLLEQGCPDEEVARILGIGTNEVFLTKKLNRNR